MANNDWTYYTNINYRENNKEDPLLRAFNTFIKELLLDPEVIRQELERTEFKRIVINTEGKNDIINSSPKKEHQSQGQNQWNKYSGHVYRNDHRNDEYKEYKEYIFLKSKFLVNKKFKQKLIDYYNQHKIYVKGPINVLKKDYSNSNSWYIDLYKLK